MSNNYKLMIPGASSSEPELAVYAPYDNKEIGSVVAADGSVIEQALVNAQTLFSDRKQWLSVELRLRILTKSSNIILSRIDELTFTAAQEGGKPLKDSRAEVLRAIDGLKSCIEVMRTQSGSEIPMGLNRASANKLAFTTHEPIGIVVAVSAFNHPVNLIVHQVAPAIATGCPVIIKPAEDTPLSCFKFVEILREAGLPDSWCQPLVVHDVNLATKLVTDPRVAFFSFIGSAKVGWMLRSKLAPGTRCALEHGGSAPVIVAADANLKKALPKILKGGLYHAGQVCVSVQRVFVHESIIESFGQQLAKMAIDLKVGDPTLAETDIGPLIRNREVNRVEKWVNEAVVRKETQLLTGGKRISNSCYECTIIVNPPRDLMVSSAEIFGPVICLYSYTDLELAIQHANDVPFSFQAAVFTENINTAMKAYKNLNASAIMVNEHTAFRVDWMPFGGLKESGLGIGGIQYTIRDMQIEKMLVLDSPSL